MFTDTTTYRMTDADADAVLASYGDDADIHAIAAEIADACGVVIFPTDALRFLAATDAAEIIAADAWVADTGLVDAETGYLRHATLVAYAVVYRRTVDALADAAVRRR